MIVYLLMAVLINKGVTTHINIENLVFKESAACEEAVKKLKVHFKSKYDQITISCQKEEVIK